MNTRLFLLLAALLGSHRASADPSFPGAGGNYGGTIEADSGANPNDSGILTVIMNERGAASLALVWQGQTYRLKGAFTGDSTFGQFNTQLVKKTPATAGTKLSLNCNLNPTNRSITGVVSDPEATSSGSFNLDGHPADGTLLEQLSPGLRMAFMDDAVAPTPREGSPLPAQALPPATGSGFAVVTLGKGTTTRSNRSVGRLADDQPFSAGSPLRSRSYALRSGLYPQRRGQPSGGQLLGNSDASTTAAPERNDAPRNFAALAAALRWHKVPNPTANAYRNGFDGRLSFNLVPYDPNRDLRFVLTGQAVNYSNASLVLSGGNLGADITVRMNLTFLGAIITGPNPSGVRIHVQPLKARFTGSFKEPGTGERVPFHGAFSHASAGQPIVPGEGKGSFLSIDRNDPNNSRSGKVHIPQPL